MLYRSYTAGAELPTLKILLLLICTMIFYALPKSAIAGRTLSFNEAVTLALSANPRMIDSHANVNAASASVTAARGEGLPSLNIEVNAARSNNPLNVFSYKLSQSSVSFNDFGAGQYLGRSSLGVQPHNLNSPGYYNNYNTGVVLNVPIFSGGDASAKTSRAKALLKAVQEGSQAAKNELIFDLMQSYAGWHTANRLVSVSEKSVNTAIKYTHLTNKLYQQSIVLKSDVMMMKAYQRSVETKLAVAKLDALNQLDAFRILIGKPNSDLIPGSYIGIQTSNRVSDESIGRAIENNPKMKALRSEINASRSALKSAESSNWPQLNLQLRHDWNADTPTLTSASNTAMLELNWKIFSSGMQYGTEKQAQAMLQHSSAAYDNASDNIRLDIRESARAVNTATIQIKAARLNIKEIETAVQLLYTRYGQGLVSLGQLLDMQTRLDEARSQLIVNEYRLLIAEARVMMLTNKLMAALNLDDSAVKDA